MTKLSRLSVADDFQSVSDDWEKKAKIDAAEAEEIPSSLNAFKSHPTYILKKHITSYFGVVPGAKKVGRFGDEPVMRRRDVVQLHTREQWLERHAKVPMEDEPTKKIPSRKKSGKETELFGPWQVTDYDPGEAVDGVVPKNEHNNVYFYKPEVKKILDDSYV